MNFPENDYFLKEEEVNDCNKEKYNYKLPLFNIYTQKDLEYPLAYRLQQDCFNSSYCRTNSSMDDFKEIDDDEACKQDHNIQNPYYPSWIKNCPLYNQVDNLNPYDEAYFNNIIANEDVKCLSKNIIEVMQQEQQQQQQQNYEEKDKIIETGPIQLSDNAWESICESSDSGDTEEPMDKPWSKNETSKTDDDDDVLPKLSSFSKKIIKKKSLKEKKISKKYKEMKSQAKESISKAKKSTSKAKKITSRTKKLSAKVMKGKKEGFIKKSPKCKKNHQDLILVPSQISSGMQDAHHQKQSIATKTYKLQIDTCNNIVKNYGKAMAGFAVNDAAMPYLQPLLTSNRVSYEGFAKFIYSHKENIDCIGNLRDVLLIKDEDDSNETKIYKKIFKDICIIFLKYFAVNWIYNGKMARKKDHLNCRFHLMRRVANPSLFTYLK